MGSPSRALLQPLSLSLLVLSLGCAATRTAVPLAEDPPPVTPQRETAPAVGAANNGGPEAAGAPDAAVAAEAVAQPDATEAASPARPPRVPFRIEPLEQDPSLARRAYQQGVVALKARQLTRAAEHLGACVAHNLRRTDCKWELGWALFQLARWQDARDVWREVAQGRRGDPEVEKALALVEAQARLQDQLTTWEDSPVLPLPPVPDDARLRLRAVGDVMLGTDFPRGYLPPGDGAPVLAQVVPLLRDADLTFVNLEGPLCDAGSSAKCGKGRRNCYAFRSPTRYGDHLVAAGVDMASTANNHSGDFGEECRRQTETALDARGIVWSGPPGSVATYLHQGLRVGMIAFHTHPSTHYLLDLETARRLVQATSRTHQVVIVSFHGGAEGAAMQHVPEGPELFFGEHRGDLRRFARAVVDAGADLVLGHGPHVLRGMELYQGRLIAYSLGNFATYGRFSLGGPQGLGVILEAVLDPQGRFVTGKLLPTRQLGEGIPHPDPSGEALEKIRALSREDFPETAVEVKEDGTITVPQAPAVSQR